MSKQEAATPQSKLHGLKAKTNGAESAELFVYDEIDSSGFYGISDKDVIAALADLKGVKQLDVRINSGGGDVFAGIAIYEALRRFPGNVTVYVDGLAASAASIIAMAGDERRISSGGFFMIHRASGAVFGTDEDMRKMADILSAITERLAVIYNERTGQDLDALREMIAAETWLDAEQSIALNFANAVSGAGDDQMRNRFAAKLMNAQRAFAQSIKAKVAGPPPEPAAAAPPDPRESAKPVNQAPVSGAFSLSRKEYPMDRESMLRERLETATIKAEQVKHKADEEGRDLTQSEVAAIRELKSEMDDIEAQLDALRIVASATQRLAAPLPRKGEEPQAARPEPFKTQVLGPVAAKRTDGGFTGGFTEFASAVRNVFTGGARDERLFRNAETSYGVGGVGSEGGFAIPEDFRREIYSNAIDQDPLVSRCFQLPTASRQVTLPTHESQPWGSDSVQSYWTGEGAAISRSKFAMNQVTIQLNKIAVLSFVSEELLEDAPALQSALIRDASGKINFAVSNAIVRGTGVNQPLGFLNAPSLVTVAAESAGGAQTADTITVENIFKMYSAMPAGNRANAVWLAHPDAEQQIWQGKWHATAEPIGFAPGTLPNQPFGTLLGRPVIPHEVCETVGDLGDLMFVDLNEYALPMKSGGLKAQTSMHLAFDQDLMAFKFTMRVGGAPLWQGPVDSRDGTFDRSPFVVLAAR